MAPIFWFMRETGCRRAEAISLRLHHVDFAVQEVVFHTFTKSGKSHRVPLTDKALWAVQALPKHGPTVFYHPSYLETFTGDGLALFWEAAREGVECDDENLKEKLVSLRMHDLRHANAIKLAEEGTPMHFISEVLDHHSSEFTRQRYARFSPGSASRAVLRVLQGRKAEPRQALARSWHSQG